LTYYRSYDATSTLEIEHGGGGFGFLSDMAWFPQLNFGVVWLSNSSDHDLQSWLTGQIISDYIDANRSTMSSRAFQSQRFDQRAFGPQDPPVLSDASLLGLIQSMALPDSAEAAARRRSYTGIYQVKAWGRTGELHLIGLKAGLLTLDGAALTEVQPGLFFASSGEALDLRGPVFHYINKTLEKIGLGTVIFYTGFIGICVLACLALLLWHPSRWLWGKIRRRARTSRATWPAWAAEVFILLGALIGLVVFGVLWKYPILILGGMPLPTPNLSTIQSVLLLSPYLMLGSALVAAAFAGLGWKSNARRDRWIELGKVALLAAYALVVI
jgi:hypothetical protein